METTNINSLKINILTQEQYNAAEKDSNQIYLITDNVANYLALTGGQMTGEIILHGDPTENLGAATKQYVDNKYSVENWTFTLEDGSTITKNVVVR